MHNGQVFICGSVLQKFRLQCHAPAWCTTGRPWHSPLIRERVPLLIRQYKKKNNGNWMESRLWPHSADQAISCLFLCECTIRNSFARSSQISKICSWSSSESFSEVSIMSVFFSSGCVFRISIPFSDCEWRGRNIPILSARVCLARPRCRSGRNSL